MRCAKCNAELDPSEKFCGDCGEPVKELLASAPSATGSCPRCGATVDLSKRFCSSCAYDLKATATQAAPPVSYPAVLAQPPGTKSSRSSRTFLLLGIGFLVVVCLVGVVGIGLWFWFRSQAQSTVAGTWNCEAAEVGQRLGTGGAILIQSRNRTFRMTVRQNKNTINATIVDDSGHSEEVVGTFDGKALSFKVLDTASIQLTLSADGSTMNGEAKELGDGKGRALVVCTRDSAPSPN